MLHADIQLGTRSNDRWSAQILSAMDSLTQSYIFKQKPQICEPIDLSRCAVDLREKHLEYWTPYSDTHPREQNSRLYLSPMVCSSYQKGFGHSFALHLSILWDKNLSSLWDSPSVLWDKTHICNANLVEGYTT